MVAPPLRDRGDDIVVLANHFLKVFSAQYQKAIQGFGSDALAAMKSYSWPGNVRELENKVKRAVIMSEKKTLTPADLDLSPPAEESHADSLKEVRGAAEREHVVEGPGEMRLEHHEGGPGAGDQPADPARLHKKAQYIKGLGSLNEGVGRFYSPPKSGDDL